MSDDLSAATTASEASPQLADQGRTTALVVYGLYAASPFLGITGLIGLIVAYVKRGDAGPVYASHMTWLIRTFWISFAACIAGLMLMFVGIGTILLVATGVWVIYRVVAGGLKALNGQPIANPAGFF